MPARSRIKKFNVAERAVALALPTPTPSKMRCVARTDRKEVHRSCILSYNMYCKYPELLSIFFEVLLLGIDGRNVDLSPD